MKCIICDTPGSYYFSKTYTEQPYAHFMRGIGTVHYEKCANCGFVFSATHSELGDQRWEDLNREFHEYAENPRSEKKGNQPPYAEQALMLKLLAVNGVIDIGSTIDFAAGHGTLSGLLARYFGISLPLFDPYVNLPGAGTYLRGDQLGKYKTVVNSAMFEHVRSRSDLDEVHNLVDHDGCLVIHTVVCENVPKNPEWFYLRPPVHIAFHTNRSMGILMDQWGYRSSIYCPQGKSWVLLKKPAVQVSRAIVDLNRELQTDWFFCKDGFVDYWKT